MLQLCGCWCSIGLIVDAFGAKYDVWGISPVRGLGIGGRSVLFWRFAVDFKKEQF